MPKWLYWPVQGANEEEFQHTLCAGFMSHRHCQRMQTSRAKDVRIKKCVHSEGCGNQ